MGSWYPSQAAENRPAKKPTIEAATESEKTERLFMRLTPEISGRRPATLASNKYMPGGPLD